MPGSFHVHYSPRSNSMFTRAITLPLSCIPSIFPILKRKLLMKILRGLFVSLLVLLFSSVHAADGVIVVKSPHTGKETMNRFEELAKQKGLNVFARIDHAAGAAKIGKSLRPTEVLIFGHPQGGTPFRECAQSVGIDLPLKALVWEDASGQVWLGYNDPAFLAQRHGVVQCPAVASLSMGLAGLAEATVAR